MAGKPQTLSQGQCNEVQSIVRKMVIKWVLIGLAVLTGITGVGLWQIKARVEKRMEGLVAKQFEEPRIHDVVRDTAAERASVLMTEQIAPDVAAFKTDVAKQLRVVYALVDETRALEAEGKAHEAAIQGVLTALENSLTEVTNELEKVSVMQADLQEISEFVLLVMQTLGDDVTAWDSLGSKAGDASFLFRKEALDVYLSVQNQFVGPEFPPFCVLQPQLAAIAQKCDVPALKAMCGEAGGRGDAHLAHIAWTRTDLSKFQKFDTLAYIIEHTRSTTARAMAGKHFAEESKDWFGHLRKTEWSEWWQKNQERIKAESDKQNAEQEN